MNTDLNFLLDKLESTHPNPYLNIKKDDFYRKLNHLGTKLLTRLAFSFELTSLLANLRDSHTRVQGMGKLLSDTIYPIAIRYLHDGYYIVKVTKELKDTIGQKVVRIGKYTIKTAVSTLSRYLIYENKIALRKEFTTWVDKPQLLKYAGITKSDSLTLSLDNGKTVDLLPEKDFSSVIDPYADATMESDTLRIKGLYWTKDYPDISTYYIQYNSCEDIEKAEIQKIVDHIDKQRPRYVVVDFRNNYGGSSLILDPLTEYLYKNQDDFIPVAFVSDKTYSSALINTLNLMDSKNAVSLGTTTSGAPTKFGQAAEVCDLPNSGIRVQISTKYFEEKGYKYGEPYTPTIEVPHTVKNYLNGVDSVWETFLKEVIKK
jgi:hypothetical protein